MIPGWAKDIFPVGQLLNVTLLSYELQAQTKIQKILNGGTLLKKIIEDSMNFKNSENSKRKLYLYSGEEKNIHGILQSLDVWVPHVLSPGAALIFEIYSDSFTKEFTVKVTQISIHKIIIIIFLFSPLVGNNLNAVFFLFRLIIVTVLMEQSSH